MFVSEFGLGFVACSFAKFCALMFDASYNLFGVNELDKVFLPIGCGWCCLSCFVGCVMACSIGS